METVVVFELRGSIAHYRRPDTLGTHASYPFIPRTTLRGLIGAILGVEYREEGDVLPAEARCGLCLLAPVKTVAQELSLHGKKWVRQGEQDSSFHRPTSLELVVNPHYRVFYAGPQADELADRLENRQSCFHTYLGSAFCLTFPEWVGRKPAEAIPPDSRCIPCATVVPMPAVGRLLFDHGEQYARAGGLSREHIGGRRFRGTVSVIYEVTGRAVTFEPASPPTDVFWAFRQVPGEGTVCLW
ncbi:MAG: CRISPR-associated protein Cas5 [Gemmataceae bacterium]